MHWHKAMTGDFPDQGRNGEGVQYVRSLDSILTVQEVNKTLGAFAGDMENSFIKAGQAMNEGVDAKRIPRDPKRRPS